MPRDTENDENKDLWFSIRPDMQNIKIIIDVSNPIHLWITELTGLCFLVFIDGFIAHSKHILNLMQNYSQSQRSSIPLINDNINC